MARNTVRFTVGCTKYQNNQAKGSTLDVGYRGEMIKKRRKKDREMEEEKGRKIEMK